MTRHVAAAVLMIATLAALASGARAAGIDTPLRGYSLASWAERDGVPVGPVYAIAQDDDGFLWLGTESGLVRFDGVRFQTADALGVNGLPAGTVRALLVDRRDSRLWVGLLGTRGLWAMEPEPATAATQYLDGLMIRDLVQDRDGRIWAGTSAGLYVEDGQAFARVESPGAPAGEVFALQVDEAGTIRAGTATGLLERAANGHFHPVDTDGRIVRGISEDPAHRLWISHPTRGFVQVGQALGVAHEFEGIGTNVYRDTRGNMWVTTRGQGLWRVYTDPGSGALVTEKASVDSGLLSDGIWSILEDVDGNIWVGTHEGLHRLMPHQVHPLTTLGLVHAVERDPAGGIWIGTASGLLHASHVGGRINVRQVVDGQDVVAIARTADGALWLAAPTGVTRLAPDGTAEPVPTEGSPASIQSISADSTGVVWAADARLGLLRVETGGLRRVPLGEDGGVVEVHVDRDDRVWLALADGRVGILGHDSHVRALEGTGPIPTYTFAEDDDGTLWLGLFDGIGRVRNGRLERVRVADGFPGRQTTAIAIDGTGTFWVAVDRSLLRMEPGAIDAGFSSAGTPLMHRRFVTAHGLAGVPIEVSGNNAVAIDEEGTMWFVTGRGVTLVDPQAAGSLPMPHRGPVHVESLTADGSRFVARDGVSLPARTTRLEIDFTTLQLSNANTPRFRYRLDGVDATWVDAGTQRQSVYTNLRPGEYLFLVQAQDDVGGWTVAPAALAFSVAPALYQTPLFFLLSAVVLAGLVWLAWTARLRIMEHRFSLALAERARLSREMHDTLLQSLVGFSLQLDGVARTEGAVSGDMRERLVRMRKQVERHIRDVRQSIWDLRSPSFHAGGLERALRDAGTRLARGGATVHVSVHGLRRPLNERIERNLLRIGQEAIANAIRHGEASRIEVELRYRAGDVSLRVADNGSGFEVDKAWRPAHYGMVSMRERAAEIRGTCEVRSTVGHGTDVEIHAPA